MTAAVLDADDTARRNFLLALKAASEYTTDLVLPIVQGLSCDELCQLVAQVVLPPVPCPPTVKTQVSIDESLDKTKLLVTGAVCGILLDLIFGQDRSVVDTQVEQLTVGRCGGALEVLQYAGPIAKTAAGATLGTAALFGQIFEMLTALLSCCPPCREHVISAGFLGDKYNKLVLVNDPTLAVSRFVFVDTSPIESSSSYFAKPQIKLLAKVRWLLRDGSISEVDFVNSDQQERRFFRDDVIGFSYWLYDGVTLDYTCYARPVWLYTIP